MPANYTLMASLCKEDPNYMIIVNQVVYPENLQVYSSETLEPIQPRKKLGENYEDLLSPEMSEDGTELSASEKSQPLTFKFYKFVDKSFVCVGKRQCHPSYMRKICVSEDGTKIALVRKIKTSEQKNGVQQCIDVFHFQKQQFFKSRDTLTQEDESLIGTIQEEESQGIDWEKVYLRFSPEGKYLYAIVKRKQIFIYKLIRDAPQDVVIKPLYQDLQCFESYDQIMNLVINESNLGDSLLACKRKDQQILDIFKISYLFSKDQTQRSSLQEDPIQRSLQDGSSAQTVLASIKYSEPQLSKCKIMFSRDSSTVIFCSKDENILLNLNQEKDIRRTISHMNGKHILKIVEYQTNQFLLVHAYPSDKEVSIRHSSDPSFRLKIKMNYYEGCSQIKDVSIQEGQEIRVLVSRDDEEYIIHHFKNMETCFEQRIQETSNFLFNWPYICQVRGKQNVLIQSAMDPIKAVQVALPMESKDFISQMCLSKNQHLFVFVFAQKKIKIYEQDLDKTFKALLKKNQPNQNIFSSSKDKKVPGSGVINQQPISVFDGSLLQGKEIEKSFIFDNSLSSSANIFLLVCDSKIYKYTSHHENHLEVIDSVYKIKKVNDRLVAYHPLAARGQKSNQIKYLLLQNSELSNGELFKENQGKLEEFQIQEGKLLCLIDSQKSEKSKLLKIFSISESLAISLVHQIDLTDQSLIENLFATEVFFNNIIASFSTCYSLVTSYKEPTIHTYQNVLQLDQGEKMVSNSPLQTGAFRKLVFFKVNKMTYSHKTAIILPYLNENYIKFNDSQSTPQINLFYKFTDDSGKEHTNILSILPSEKQVLLYSMKGQLIQDYKLKSMYARFGDRIVGISQNGEYFLHANDKSPEPHILHLIQICMKERKRDIEDIMASYLRKSVVGEEKGGYQRPFINVEMVEDINMKEFYLPSKGTSSKKEDLFGALDSFNQRNCQVLFRVNNEQDVLISVLYIDEKVIGKKYLKELILLKKHENEENKRTVHLIKLDKKQQGDQQDQSIKGSLKEKLLQPEQKENENKFEDCFDCQISDQIIVAWSKRTLYYQELCALTQYDESIYLQPVNLEMKDGDGYEIDSVNVYAQGNNEWKQGNYNVVIKLVRENKESTIIRYNLFKQRSFSTYECHKDAQACFNLENRSFIIDQDYLISMYEKMPLYYYKVGFQNFKGFQHLKEYIHLGSRFSNYKQDSFFMVKNGFHMTYSYIDIVASYNWVGQALTKDNFDPEKVFTVKGFNLLHNFASRYSQLKFILDTYEQTNPKLINQLLLKNLKGKTALQLAIQAGNASCVNLILEKLTHLSFNNVHAVKDEFGQLVQFNSFETYLSMCFFQTKQMKSIRVLNCKEFSENEPVHIEPYNKLFLDKKFHTQVALNANMGKQEQIEKVRPVVIQALDAGWIFQTDEGKDFLVKLSESDNLNYYGLESVRVIIKFLWNVYKPRIVLFLFVPFLINWSLFLFFSAYLYDAMHEQQDRQSTDTLIAVTYHIVRFTLLAFTVATYSVEYAKYRAEKRQKSSRIWSIIDLTSATLIPIIFLMDWLAQCTDLDIKPLIRPVIAATQLILFLRLFYFLRIFDQTSHFVRILLNVPQDLVIIMVVLLLGIFASGSTFYILSDNNRGDTESAPYLNNLADSFLYAYLLQIGYYQVDAFADSSNSHLMWLLFILATVFGIIIMFNTLVAIMSYSFTMKFKRHENLVYQEHLQLIVERHFLTSSNKFEDVKYLIAIRNDSEVSTQDSVIEAISQLKDNVQDMAAEIKNLKQENTQQLSYFLSLNAKIGGLEKERKLATAKGEQEVVVKEKELAATGKEQLPQSQENENEQSTGRGQEEEKQDTKLVLPNYLKPLLAKKLSLMIKDQYPLMKNE